MNNQLTSKKVGTRERIVEAARELFFRQGYTATGIAQILQVAHANSGSLYYFFPTKEDVLVAVLERYKELLQPAVLDPAYARSSDPIERIFLVLDGYRQLLAATDFVLGCPIGNLALEVSNSNPKVRALIVENFQAWRVAIRSLLEEAKDRLPRDMNHDEVSHFVLATMEGAVMLARAHHDFTPLDSVISSLRSFFKAMIAQRTDGSDS